MKKKVQMFNLIQEWESRAVTIKSFCLSKGIKSPTFYYWLKRYRTSRSTSGFQSIDIPASPPPNPILTDSVGHLQISFPNGVLVRVDSGVSISWLTALIHSYDEPTA